LQLLGAYSHRHSVTARVRALLELMQVRLAGLMGPESGGPI
jgi:hypothetical protein